MRPAARLQRYRELQLALLQTYGELQLKIEESVREGQADLLAVQAAKARSLALEFAELERAARPLAAFAGQGLQDLEARLAGEREAALRANRDARALLGGALQELAGRIRDLAARPRTPLSPFARIGQPTLVDIRS
jgi:hypothetical protein